MEIVKKDNYSRPICSKCGLEVTSYSYACNWCGAKLPHADVSLSKGLLDLLKSPRDFFADFVSYFPVFMIMYCGYYFFSFANIVGNVMSNSAVMSNSVLSVKSILISAVLSSVFSAFFWVPLIVEIWLVLGVKMFRGNANLKLIVLSVGYALFWPGLLSLTSIPFAMASFITMNKILNFISVAIQTIANISSLIYVGIAIKTVNRLSLKQLLAVFLWPIAPILLLIVYRIG